MAPETRSSDTRCRLDFRSAMDGSRRLCFPYSELQLALWFLLAVMAMSRSHTHFECHAPASHDPDLTELYPSLQFGDTHRRKHSLLAPIFSHLGYLEFATAAPSRSDSKYFTASFSNGPSAIFAPGRCLTVKIDSINGKSSTAADGPDEAPILADFKETIFKKLLISPSMVSNLGVVEAHTPSSATHYLRDQAFVSDSEPPSYLSFVSNAIDLPPKACYDYIAVGWAFAATLSPKYRVLVLQRDGIFSHDNEQEEESRSNENHVSMIRGYRSNIETELSNTCDGILELLGSRLIPSASFREPKAFYLKTKGDYHKYLAELTTESKHKAIAESTLPTYDSVQDIANTELPPTHLTGLGLALNFSVFSYEILNSPDRTCNLAKQAFDDQAFYGWPTNIINMAALKAAGANWIQFDDPTLVKDLDEEAELLRALKLFEADSLTLVSNAGEGNVSIATISISMDDNNCNKVVDVNSGDEFVKKTDAINNDSTDQVPLIHDDCICTVSDNDSAEQIAPTLALGGVANLSAKTDGVNSLNQSTHMEPKESIDTNIISLDTLVQNESDPLLSYEKSCVSSIESHMDVSEGGGKIHNQRYVTTNAYVNGDESLEHDPTGLSCLSATEYAFSSLNVPIETYLADIATDAYKTLTSLKDVTAYAFDLVRGIQTLDLIKAGLPSGRYLFAGVDDGRNSWTNDLAASLRLLQDIGGTVGKYKLVVSTSYFLLHTAVDHVDETKLLAKLKSWLLLLPKQNSGS